jgi:hypothetical protein
MNYVPPQLSEDVENTPSPIICAKAIIIADLVSYGENEIAKYVISQNESDYSRYYKRLASIANWFLHNVPSGRKDGGSITFSKAFTLAAIFLCEGAYREPIKKKRILVHRQKIVGMEDDETIIRYIDEIS